MARALVLPYRPMATLAGGDEIAVRNLRVYGRHGVLPCEREMGQVFEVSVRMQVDRESVKAAARDDDVGKTVDYSAVAEVRWRVGAHRARPKHAHSRERNTPHKTARRIVEGPPHRNLIERVAEDVAEAVLGSQPLVHAVTVTVGKPHVVLAGGAPSDGSQVALTRSR